MLNMALLCTNPSPTLRPPMSTVVSMIEGNKKVDAPTVSRTTTDDDMRFKSFEKLSHDSYSQESRGERTMSMDGPWVDTSMSFQSKDTDIHNPSSQSKLLPDLYDVNIE